MIKKITFTIALVSCISMVMAQNVEQGKKSIQTKSTQSTKNVNTNNKPTQLDVELIPVQRQAAQKNEKQVMKPIRYIHSDQPAVKQNSKNNK